MTDQNPNLSDIQKLQELKDKGLLTQQEFEEKKNRILNQGTFSNNNKTPKKSSGCLKVGFFLLIGFLAFLAFYFIGSNISKTTEDKNQTKISQESNKSQGKSKIAEIDDVITSIKNDKDKYNDANWQLYLTIFHSGAKLVHDNTSDKSDSLQTKVKELKKALSNYQVKLLPKMRNSYAKAAKEKLWRSNIEVAILGSNNTTLQFTGGSLASNANKEDFMKAMNEMVNELRFKKINLKWYEYDDEYTYYKLDTKSDSELYD